MLTIVNCIWSIVRAGQGPITGNCGDWVQSIIANQRRLSARFDGLLAASYRLDGARDFQTRFLPGYLQAGSRIYDIGGGKSPYLSPEEKERLDATVIGLDIDPRELLRAPAGAYDLAVCADVTRYLGAQDADLGICQTLLEHVRDVDAALRSIATCLRPGGRLVVFVPSGNALYARLNRLLPTRVQQALLNLYASGRQRDIRGFPAYYDRCTPRELAATALGHGLELEDARYYFTSGYFSIFFPAHVLWRLWLILFRSVAGPQAAETFAMTFRKVDRAA